MAPNVKRVALLSHSLSDLRVIRPKDALYQPSVPVINSESYWEWESPVDLFCADHVTANLLKSKAAVVTSESSSTNASSDNYWAEEGVSSVTTPLQDESYWTEASHTQTAADDYWSEAAPVHHAVPVSASYWNEAVHSRTVSDSYWSEGESSAKYWGWNAAELTSQDRYWSM